MVTLLRNIGILYGNKLKKKYYFNMWSNPELLETVMLRYHEMFCHLISATLFWLLQLSPDYCHSLLYNIASKDILKLYCVQNCLLGFSHGLLGFPILSHFWNLFTGYLLNLGSFSNSRLGYCLSNSFCPRRTFIYICHAFYSTQAQIT